MKTLAGIFAVPLAAGLNHQTSARSYPTRPIRFVIPPAPSGGPDVVARMLVPELSQTLGQSIVVDNRAGANALIGADLVAKSAPDGYTWLMAIGQNTVNPSLVKKMPRDIVKDFAPVTPLLKSSFLLVVHPSLPAKTVKELIAFAKTCPAGLNFGSGGVGSGAHLFVELFKIATGINMSHVPGVGRAMPDPLTGRSILCSRAVCLITKTGALGALRVTGARRHPSLPDIPTIG